MVSLLDGVALLLLLLRFSIGGVAYVTVFNSSATWAATFRLRGYKYSACWLFLCFRYPPNSDVDYRIFNVYMVFGMHVYIHTGVGHTDSKSAQPF